jgi:hypothetical protein
VSAVVPTDQERRCAVTSSRFQDLGAAVWLAHVVPSDAELIASFGMHVILPCQFHRAWPPCSGAGAFGVIATDLRPVDLFGVLVDSV